MVSAPEGRVGRQRQVCSEREKVVGLEGRGAVSLQGALPGRGRWTPGRTAQCSDQSDPEVEGQ